MTVNTLDARIDRLYQLLPAIYRMRDAEQQYPLRALLRVIAEQVNVVEDDIAQLYENWFIETAEDWAVPYIADLIGYRPVLDPGASTRVSTREQRALNRVLVPRREVANTIRYRRRKGTLALLELLANDVAAWPARAVEFFKLLGWNQNLNHQHLKRAQTVDLRATAKLELLNGPFDQLAHTVDVRRINSHRSIGHYNIPSVGVFIWRLKSYSVTYAPAYCAENTGPHCYTFSVLGQDAPLFIRPERETKPTHIAEELNLPVPIRRFPFEQHMDQYYGQNKSCVIWAEGWADTDPEQPIPAEMILAADLSDWHYVPPLKHIALDPVLGRFAFPPSQLPKKGVRVMYHHAYSADMGGGEYQRNLFDPPGREVEVPNPEDASKLLRQTIAPTIYRVGEHQEFHRIGEALQRWKQDHPWEAVIELTDSGVYVEPIYIELGADQTLLLRASSGVRPVIRLLDWQTDVPDALSVMMDHGSRFSLDGILVTGRAVHITGPNLTQDKPGLALISDCRAEVLIRHCTLVPGWGLDPDCGPHRAAEPSLELFNVRATLRIEHSILGSILVNEDEVTTDPITVHISDSILDAAAPQTEVIGAPGYAVAHVVLTILRCTVFGIVDVHAVELAENSIFNDCVNVARRQIGCVRYCYVLAGCRTPRRHHCLPDLLEQAIRDDRTLSHAEQSAAIANERLRVKPQFTSVRYGTPAYAQLGLNCADEIKSGSDDETEMGAFHDLFQPQRLANLHERLDEYTPAGMDVGIIVET